MKYLFLFKHPIRSSSLFVKVASIVLISVILVSSSITFVSIEMSKKSFVDTFSKSNSKVLTQITQNFSTLNDQIINVLNRISESAEIEKCFSRNDLSPTEEYSTTHRMQIYLKNAIPSNNFNDITIIIAGLNGKAHSDNAALINLDTTALLASSITKQAINEPKTISYQYSKEGYNSNQAYQNSIVVTKALRTTTTKEVYGVAYVFLRPEIIQNFYAYFVGTANSVMMLDQDGVIVSSSETSQIGTKNAHLLDTSEKILKNHYTYYNTKIKSTSVAIMTKFMPSYNFNIIGIINKDEMLSEMYNTSQIILITLIIAALTLLFSFLIVRQTTKPISMLVNKMSQITTGNFNNYIPVTGSYEAKELANAFNYMLDGLNNYMIQQTQMQNDKRKAEIHALQMQINPHFIYNTLSSIKWLLWQGHTEKSIQSIDAFISLLQNTISNRKEMIPVELEIENLKNYVLINQVRYGNHIAVNFFVLPGCENYMVPKLILQPFVENAFFHAFLEKTSGRIRIFVQEQNGILTCEIMDNGIGMDGSQLDKAFREKGQHLTGIGIQNVNDRIKLLYGDSYGVSVKSEPNRGTTVRVIFPAHKQEQIEPNNIL